MLSSLFKLPNLISAWSWPSLASLVGLAGLSLSSSDSDLNINKLKGTIVPAGLTGAIEGELSYRFDLFGVLAIWTIIRDPMLAPSKK